MDRRSRYSATAFWNSSLPPGTVPRAAARSVRDRLNRILVKHTGQTVKKIEKDTDRDYYMSAEEAKEYGIVDEIIETRKVAPKQ